MGNPMDVGSFGDLLDKRVTKMFYDELEQLPDRVSEFYGMETSKDSFEKWGHIGELGDFTEFNGVVPYQNQAQGYDATAEHIAFANGFMVTRQMYDDDRHGIWERKSPALANSYMRTRQGHAARIFNNAFAVDVKFSTNSEGVALCSASHTTTSGASTSVGFSNYTTAGLSAVALSSLRTTMRYFRGDVANRILVTPNRIVAPIDLEDRLEEIIKTQYQPDTANNNYNPQMGRWSASYWEYLTDSNNWFMVDEKHAKEWLVWFDRIPLEFGRAEEFDTFVAKWRAYARYSYFWLNWRWIAGANVS